MTDTNTPRANLLIEGWRGINHSFALVNQCQLLELLKFPDLQITHRDLPFFMPHWNTTTVDAGFAPADRDRIAAVPEPGDQPIDCVYRAGFPYGGDFKQRTLTFMITEFGLSAASFQPQGQPLANFTRDGNRVLTSTNWSRERLIEYGLDEAGVQVVPCGVSTATFHPLIPEERALNRANLGISQDALVFLNLGAAIWNKGVDLLLTAFARLCQRHPGRTLVLILKDQRSLYKVSVEAMLRDVAARQPELFTPATLAAIRVVGSTLSQAQLRLLYGIADSYVSPYRAEGFNLPVLEAIACGTPVVVTAGGATDDFCPTGIGRHVSSVAGTRTDGNDGALLRYREPDPESLLEAMDSFVQGSAIDPPRFALARKAVLETMTWGRAAQSLRDLVHSSGDAATPADAIRLATSS